jgi:hypothetical protein
MRKISLNEIEHGMFVQCLDSYTTQTPTILPTIYQILIEDDKLYYRVEGSDWKMPFPFQDMGVWYETNETIQLNRDRKLNIIIPQ